MDKKLKCVVWDLDNTIWNGTLLENDKLALMDGIEAVLKTLDERGILQSIASKNDFGLAMKKLEEFGIDEYFIYPQINWNSKAESLKEIAALINIGIDTLAFVDDQITEREEIKFAHPSVTVIDACDYKRITDMPELKPKFITEDSKKRRMMYKSDIERKQEEERFTGSSEEFLSTLNMRLTLSNVKSDDLKRVEELTVRTNQLNSTGYTYSYDELMSYINSDKHVFMIAGLQDKFGDYGKIGLVLLESDASKYTIKLLLMSCRVMTKGIGSAILVYLTKIAKANNKSLFAEFLDTGKNRLMYITYKFMGFEEVESMDNKVLFKYESNINRDYPEYLNINIG